MKVRMQMSTSLTMRQIIANTLKIEGILGFYKGMAPPFITVPIINSIIFASYEFSKRLMNVKSE